MHAAQRGSTGRRAASDRDERRDTAEHGDLDLAERERERLDQPRQQRDGRDQEHRDLRARGERDLGGELDLAAVRDDDRAAVLGGVADDRDDHGGDEELAQPGLSANSSSEPTRISATSAVTTVATREHDAARAGATSPGSPRRRDVQRAVAPQRVPGHADVDDEQHDRDGIESMASESRFGSPSQPGIAGTRKSSDRERRSSAERDEARLAVDLAASAEEQREAEHEQEVADHASRSASRARPR